MKICEPNWDVAIVGAGPAGSFAAHQLALRGYKTLLIENLPGPAKKFAADASAASLSAP